MAKPEALQQAQLSIESMPQYQRPYYWAGFVLMGDGHQALFRWLEVCGFCWVK